MQSNDIVKTVAALREHGVLFITTPDTYYDIVEERVGEIEQDWADLRSMGILADRDEEGYLLQLFTKIVRTGRRSSSRSSSATGRADSGSGTSASSRRSSASRLAGTSERAQLRRRAAPRLLGCSGSRRPSARTRVPSGAARPPRRADLRRRAARPRAGAGGSARRRRSRRGSRRPGRSRLAARRAQRRSTVSAPCSRCSASSRRTRAPARRTRDRKEPDPGLLPKHLPVRPAVLRRVFRRRRDRAQPEPRNTLLRISGALRQRQDLARVLERAVDVVSRQPDERAAQAHAAFVVVRLSGVALPGTPQSARARRPSGRFGRGTRAGRCGRI